MSSHKEGLKSLNKKQGDMDFLKRIIFRLDFSTNVDVSDKKRQLFSSGIASEFSGPQVEARKTLQVTMSAEGNLLSQGQANLYHFANANGTKKVILEPTALSVFFFSYVDPAELLSTLKLVGSEFNKVYKNMQVIRTGLMHSYRLDRIEGDPFEWDDYISENLISPIKFHPNTEELVRVMSLIELTKWITKKDELTKEDKPTDDYYRVTIQAGLSNSVDYPNPITSKEFTLDYDCYSLKQQGISSALKLVSTFNNENMDLFRASTAPRFHKTTEVKEDA